MIGIMLIEHILDHPFFSILPLFHQFGINFQIEQDILYNILLNLTGLIGTIMSVVLPIFFLIFQIAAASISPWVVTIQQEKSRFLFFLKIAIASLIYGISVLIIYSVEFTPPLSIPYSFLMVIGIVFYSLVIFGIYPLTIQLLNMITPKGIVSEIFDTIGKNQSDDCEFQDVFDLVNHGIQEHNDKTIKLVIEEMNVRIPEVFRFTVGVNKSPLLDEFLERTEYSFKKSVNSGYKYASVKIFNTLFLLLEVVLSGNSIKDYQNYLSHQNGGAITVRRTNSFGGYDRDSYSSWVGKSVDIKSKIIYDLDWLMNQPTTENNISIMVKILEGMHNDYIKYQKITDGILHQTNHSNQNAADIKVNNNEESDCSGLYKQTGEYEQIKKDILKLSTHHYDIVLEVLGDAINHESVIIAHRSIDLVQSYFNIIFSLERDKNLISPFHADKLIPLAALLLNPNLTKDYSKVFEKISKIIFLYIPFINQLNELYFRPLLINLLSKEHIDEKYVRIIKKQFIEQCKNEESLKNIILFPILLDSFTDLVTRGNECDDPVLVFYEKILRTTSMENNREIFLHALVLFLQLPCEAQRKDMIFRSINNESYDFVMNIMKELESNTSALVEMNLFGRITTREKEEEILQNIREIINA